ncbi:MAG TPA: hypothetical protein VI958_05740 [Acidobacteriota bacterium]
MRCIFALLLIATSVFAEDGELLLNAGFDDANLNGWRISGDLCVAPSFCAGEPSGRYWVAFSTNNAADPITMCGSASIGGLQSILRSPDLVLPFTPSKIRVEFNLKFLTNENTDTDLGADNFVVRLLTMAGPVVIAAFDDSGASPGSKNLNIAGATAFVESLCRPTWRHETGVLHVSYYRTFRPEVSKRMKQGPVALEFALENQFDEDFDSAVVLDDVQLRVYR